jgi:hypothetical protein
MRQFNLLMSEKSHNTNFNLDEDLGPPVFFLDAVSDLRTILSAYDSSMAPIEQDEKEIHAILDVSLTPYIEHCEDVSKSLPALSQWIMLDNCYDLARVPADHRWWLTAR